MGRAQYSTDQFARRNRDPTELHVLGGDPRNRELCRRFEAEQLLDGGLSPVGLLPQERHLPGVVEKSPYPVGNGICRVVIGRPDQDGGHGEEFVLTQRSVPVVLRDHRSHHVVGRLGPPVFDDVAEVGAELVSRRIGTRQHGVVGHGLAGLDQSVRPGAAAFLVIGRHSSEHFAHHGDGNLPGEITEEIATSGGFHPLQQPIDQLGGEPPQVLHGARDEEAADRPANPGVIRWVEERHHVAQELQGRAVLEAGIVPESEAHAEGRGSEQPLACRVLAGEPHPRLAPL